MSTGPSPVCSILIEDISEFTLNIGTVEREEISILLLPGILLSRREKFVKFETSFCPPEIFLLNVPRRYFFYGSSSLSLSLTYCRACVLQVCCHLMG